MKLLTIRQSRNGGYVVDTESSQGSPYGGQAWADKATYAYTTLDGLLHFLKEHYGKATDTNSKELHTSQDADGDDSL